jgi:hypothetical protein
VASQARHLRARVAALSRHGTDPVALDAARRELAATNVRRLVAAERARQGRPGPSSDLEVIGFVAEVLTQGGAA